MTANIALTMGITGQNGVYCLAALLLPVGDTIFGVYRLVSAPNFWRLQVLDIRA